MVRKVRLHPSSTGRVVKIVPYWAEKGKKFGQAISGKKHRPYTETALRGFRTENLFHFEEDRGKLQREKSRRDPFLGAAPRKSTLPSFYILTPEGEKESRRKSSTGRGDGCFEARHPYVERRKITGLISGRKKKKGEKVQWEKRKFVPWPIGPKGDGNNLSCFFPGGGGEWSEEEIGAVPLSLPREGGKRKKGGSLPGSSAPQAKEGEERQLVVPHLFFKK